MSIYQNIDPATGQMSAGDLSSKFGLKSGGAAPPGEQTPLTRYPNKGIPPVKLQDQVKQNRFGVVPNTKGYLKLMKKQTYYCQNDGKLVWHKFPGHRLATRFLMTYCLGIVGFSFGFLFRDVFFPNYFKKKKLSEDF